MKYPSWYTNPEMMGHHYAKDTLNLALEIKAKYAKTKKQKELFNNSIDINNELWQYWGVFTSNSYLKMLQYALRRVDKYTPFELFHTINSRHGLLKTDLLRYLEVYAYTKNQEEFLKEYCYQFGYYGMGKEDSIKRCHEYIKGVQENYNYKVS